jgi:hypothetical protein
MTIVFSKDGSPARYVPPMLCLSFFRAFRAELWRMGAHRDPQAGDELMGVKIVSLSF